MDNAALNGVLKITSGSQFHQHIARGFFWRKNNGAKAALEMLVKLTPGRRDKDSFFFLPSINLLLNIQKGPTYVVEFILS